MNENRPPFFLELEGYEAGHSAAESLTNSLQTAQCATENGQTWDHRSGLRIACPIAGDAHADVPFALVNGGKEPITVNHFSRCIRLAMGTARPQDMLLHYFGCCWQAEYQYHCLSFADADIVPVSVHPVVKSFSLCAAGAYTTCTFYPFLAVENRGSGELCFLSFEPTANWRIEAGVQDGYVYIAAAEIDARHLGTAKRLEPGERYVLPRVLCGIVCGGLDAAVKALIRLRRRGEGKPFPVVFNDYMNCLWAQPCAEKTYPLIDAAAEAGAEVFCIDDGWQYEVGADRTARLGDWEYSRTLFGKEGFAGVIRYIRQKGMIPGLWLEMEVAGENSRVYRQEDWFLMRGGTRVGGGARAFLDFRKPAVRSYIRKKVRDYYQMGIRYIKNDYNDCIGNSGFDGIEYTRAVRSFYRELREEFPDLILENCGSGGLRSDYGMLRIFDVQSTSDQEIAANYPSIVQGALAMLLPEKAGIWAYPFPHLYDDFYGNRDLVPESYDDESVVYTMLAGMCGALCLSGRIDRATKTGKERIAQGVKLYKDIRAFTARSYPSFPNGIVRIAEKHKPVTVLYTNERESQALLFVWRQEGEAEIDVPISSKSAVCIYPAGASQAKPEADRLTVRLERPYTARLFKLTI